MVLLRIPNPGYLRTPNLWLFRGLQTLGYFKDSKPLVWRTPNPIKMTEKKLDVDFITTITRKSRWNANNESHYASAFNKL
jgi:hypothetical protein